MNKSLIKLSKTLRYAFSSHNYIVATQLHYSNHQFNG
jgi:hypothetical protein